MEFRYTVSTADNKILKGVIDADSEDRAETALYEEGYQHVLQLKTAPAPVSIEDMLPSLFGVKPQDVVDFSHQLADLVESGVDILTALQLLESQPNKRGILKTITGLIEQFHYGRVLSEALGKYPEVFSDTYQNVIRASEHAGNLEVGLRQMAEYLQRQMEEARRVRKAAAYPVIVMVMAVGVLALMVTVVLPPLTSLFSSFGAELPMVTKIVLGVAGFLIDYKLHLLLALIAGVGGSMAYLRTRQGQMSRDAFLLKVPLIGPINVDRCMAQFCRRVAMLLQAGLSLPTAMGAATRTIGNKVVARSLESVREQSIQGMGMAEPMSRDPVFPPLMVGRLQVAEKSGRLEPTLESLATFYERKASRRLDNLVSTIEPAMTVGIGLIIGLIALSVVTPLYSIAGASM